MYNNAPSIDKSNINQASFRHFLVKTPPAPHSFRNLRKTSKMMFCNIYLSILAYLLKFLFCCYV